METGLVKSDVLQPIAISPEAQVQKASEMARVLQRVVKEAKLARKFGGEKEHLQFEAWQTIGQFFNCTPITEWTKPIMEEGKIIGWESRVNVVNTEGRVIGCAESMCMRDEANWRNKPNYALRSMSQTRAGGKALRSIFAWVAVLAGYSGTPAEEMDESFEPYKEHVHKEAPPQPQDAAPKPWSDPQRKKIWAMCRGEKALTEDGAKKLLDFYMNKYPSEMITVDGKKGLTSKGAYDLSQNFETVFEEFTHV